MRTTLNIDDRVMATVRSLATYRKVSLGQVVSELIQKDLEKERVYYSDSEVPVFQVSESAPAITLEDIQEAGDEPF